MIPDVSLQKARLARIHLAGKADIWSDNGYGFAVEEPEGVLGRTFAVESIEPYDPKRLKRELKGREAEVLKRDFPLAAEELMPPGAACRGRPAAGLHENRERFLGYPFKIATFA